MTEVFSQLEVDSSYLSQRDQNVPCPRVNCQGYLVVRGEELLCPVCLYVETVDNYEESYLLHSQRLQSQQTDKQMHDKKEKYYFDPQKRRYHGLEETLKYQLLTLQSRHDFSDDCSDILGLVKGEKLPTWMNILVFYFGSKSVFFLDDFKNMFMNGVLSYKNYWKSIYNKFKFDVNSSEVLKNIKNVSVNINTVPYDVREIWLFGVKLFHGNYGKLSWNIERVVVNLVSRLLQKNSDRFVEIRSKIVKQVVVLLKKMKFVSIFIDEFRRNKYVNINPPEISLIPYILVSIKIIFDQRNDFDGFINEIKSNERFIDNTIRIDHNKFITMPKNYNKLNKYLYINNMDLEALSYNIGINYNNSDDIYVNKLPKRIYKRYNKVNKFIQSVAKRSKEFLVISEKRVFRKYLKYDYNNQSDMMDVDEDCDRIKVEELSNSNSNWGYLFDLLQRKVGLLKRDPNLKYRICKLNVNNVYQKIEKLHDICEQ